MSTLSQFFPSGSGGSSLGNGMGVGLTPPAYNSLIGVGPCDYNPTTGLYYQFYLAYDSTGTSQSWYLRLSNNKVNWYPANFFANLGAEATNRIINTTYDRQICAATDSSSTIILLNSYNVQFSPNQPPQIYYLQDPVSSYFQQATTQPVVLSGSGARTNFIGSAYHNQSNTFSVAGEYFNSSLDPPSYYVRIWLSVSDGNVWQAGPTFQSSTDSIRVQSYVAQGDTAAFILLLTNSVYSLRKTTDGGRTFQEINSNAPVRKIAAGIGDNLIGIESLNGSSLYYTTDGGIGWVQATLPPNFNAPFSNIYYSQSKSTFYAVSSEGHLLSSVDGGVTYTHTLNQPGYVISQNYQNLSYNDGEMYYTLNYRTGLATINYVP